MLLLEWQITEAFGAAGGRIGTQLHGRVYANIRQNEADRIPITAGVVTISVFGTLRLFHWATAPNVPLSA